MLNTVRKRILDEVATRLATIDGPGGTAALVVGPGVDTDIITKALMEEGRYVINLVVDDDEVADDVETNRETFTFRVIAVIRIPPTKIKPPSVDARQPYDVASDVCAEVYKLYGVDADKGTWNNLAHLTRPVGGGGVAFVGRNDELVETMHQFEIQYGHLRSDPTVPA